KQPHARHGDKGRIMARIVLGSQYALMPLCLNHQGVSDSGLGFWRAVMGRAGILGQWPGGRLADRYGRLLGLRVQGGVVSL
ncbi:MFS transporter, partial [Klebsiella pneumoniae]|nr:MFS transporter [Klebsiella pneumoniae]